MPAPRTILHVDMDAFYASVEQRDNPRLRGKPVLVGHDGPRGVVAAASYEARVFGCRSAQPMVVAKRLCPNAIIVDVNMPKYRDASDTVFAIFDQFTPLVEPLSIDEAFLDLTGTARLLGPPDRAAAEIKSQIKAATALNASVGVAPNKFLAKLASDLRKPNALVVIPPDQIDAILSPLSITKLWGIGPKSAEKLELLGLRTIAQLRAMPDAFFQSHFGQDAARLQNLCRGIDDRPVIPDRDAKSIGHEQTFSENLADQDLLRAVLLQQVEAVARRLRKHHLLARTISLKLRFGDFHTITRAATLRAPTDATTPILDTALHLFHTWAADHFSPVRLIGVTAKELTSTPAQLDLFADPQSEKSRQLDQTLDAITQKFGTRIIHRGAPEAPKKWGTTNRRPQD